MALQKTVVPLPIDKGLDTKFDSKQEQPGYLTLAENVIYETILKYRKRNGYDALLRVPENTLASLKFKNELLAATGNSLHSYSEALEDWIYKGPLYATSTRTDVIIKTAGSQSHLDSLIVNNIRASVWADDDGTVRYSVQDLNSDAFLVSNSLVDTGETATLGQISNVFYIVYIDSGDVKLKTFNITSASTLSGSTTIASDAAGSALLDSISDGSYMFVSYNSSTNLKTFRIADGSTTSSILGLSGQNATTALDLYLDSANRLVLTWSDGTDVKAAIYSYTLSATILGATTIETVDCTTCCAIESATGYTVYYEVEQAGASNNYIKSANMTTAGSVSGIEVFKRSVGLASRVFSLNGNVYVPTVYESTLQSTYFLLDASGKFVTKYANQTAAGVLTTGVLPTTNIVGSVVYLAGLFRNRLREGDSQSARVFYSTTGALVAKVDFAPTSVYSNAELADALHICAGLLKMYDGSTVSEHGFNAFPEELSSPSAATTGGLLTDGNRAYKAVYRWTDNSGRDHFSAPTTTPLEVVLSGGTSTQTATVRVPTLRLTEKQGVVLDLYRTEDNGTQYYKVTSTLTPTSNDVSVDYVDIVDGISDTALISRELLYTTGDVFENIPAPAAFQVSAYAGQRLAVVGEQSNRVYYSKISQEGQPVEFTDFIYRDTDPIAGPLTAIRNMNDRMVAFTEGACFYMSGDGPLNTGISDTFTNFEIIATDVGCSAAASLCLLPTGLMFKSLKGIYHLSGGLSLEYIGARVEQFNSQVVTAATIVGSKNQARFLLSEDRALVYNYALDRWATFENHGGLSSVAIGDQYYYVREDGSIYKEASHFSDAGSPIKMRLETGWLTFTPLQGFQRAYRALLLGDYKSEHNLRVKVAYDFNSAYTQDTVVQPADFVSAPLYGADSPYGSGSPYGGSGALYQARIDFAQQKCQSMRLLIEDEQGEAGEGLSLSAITLLVGAKFGTNKVGATAQYGTS